MRTGLKVKQSEERFQTLNDQMLQFRDKCQTEHLSISKIHVIRFLEVIGDLINEQKQKLEEV